MNNFHLPYLNHWLIPWLPSFTRRLFPSKLQGSPTPFEFDLPHSGSVLSDFTPDIPAEVSQLLRSTSNKSSPLEYIPTLLLKSCADTVSILISHLANLSFTQCQLFHPNSNWHLSHRCWKKPGLPKSDLANVRPISNLNTIEQNPWAYLPFHVFFLTFQNLPVFLLYSLLIVNFILLRLLSLSSQMIVMETMDSGEITILTALDMSAAFDTLDHITLLDRLQHTFGLIWLCYWIRSYLTDRSSFVKIDSSSSPSTTILTDVPQGSVLGPLLFVLFISTVSQCHKFWSFKTKIALCPSKSMMLMTLSITLVLTREHLLPRSLRLNLALRESMTGFWIMVSI